MRQTTLSREDFITALVSLCGGDNPAFDPDQDAQARLPPHLITAEVALHELCHVVSLGLDWEKLEKIATHNGRRPAPAWMTRAIGRQISGMLKGRSDHDEIVALAIECEVMAAEGWEVDIERFLVANGVFHNFPVVGPVERVRGSDQIEIYAGQVYELVELYGEKRG